jgi:hypothetical protein
VSRGDSAPRRRYGSLREAAIYTGQTDKALQKRVERGEIPVRRAGRKLIFDFVLLDQWVASLPGTSLEEALERCTGAAEGRARDR